MLSKAPTRYRKFADDIETLKRVAGVECNCAELDSYLWVAGEYWYWKNHPTYRISSDLKPCFENLHTDPSLEPPLAALLGIAVSIPPRSNFLKIRFLHLLAQKAQIKCGGLNTRRRARSPIRPGAGDS